MNDFTQWFKDLDDQFWNVGHYSKLSFFHRQTMAEFENRQKVFDTYFKIADIKSETEYKNYIMDYIENEILEKNPNVAIHYANYLRGKATGTWPKWTYEKEKNWMKMWNDSMKDKNDEL